MNHIKLAAFLGSVAARKKFAADVTEETDIEPLQSGKSSEPAMAAEAAPAMPGKPEKPGFFGRNKALLAALAAAGLGGAGIYGAHQMGAFGGGGEEGVLPGQTLPETSGSPEALSGGLEGGMDPLSQGMSQFSGMGGQVPHQGGIPKLQELLQGTGNLANTIGSSGVHMPPPEGSPFGELQGK